VDVGAADTYRAPHVRCGDAVVPSATFFCGFAPR
jgi:hypothetical protein